MVARLKQFPGEKKGEQEAARFLLHLEYDGTAYSGWQAQKDARTLQGTLLSAAAGLFENRKVELQGCGRTDAGVHALDYVAHLEVVTSMEPAAIMAALNEALPKDIVVLAVERAHPRFHARHSCIARSYLYRIAKRKSAFGKKYVWWVREPLDVAAMREAAAPLVGMHDFAAFAERQELKKSTMVLVQAFAVSEDEESVLVRVVASHFLWKMVRRMVAQLVEVGRHQLAPGALAELLVPGATAPPQFIAPAAGLFFERAFYDPMELADFLAGDHSD